MINKLSGMVSQGDDRSIGIFSSTINELIDAMNTLEEKVSVSKR